MEKKNETNTVGFAYYSAAAPREEGGKRLVDIRVIDTNKNANDWRVTDEALTKALHTLIGTPLLAYPDHTGTVSVGRFVNVTKPDGYAVATAEITDSQAWEKIKTGQWRWVSPQVYALITRKNEEDVDIVEDFVFDHVAFVPSPAYSSTQVLNASIPPSFTEALTATLAANQASGSRVSQLSGHQVTATQPASAAGDKRREEETLSQDITALQTKVTELTEQNKTLKASLDAIKAERHAEKVKNLLELRTKAGLFDASKRAEETANLTRLSDEVLDQLANDTENLIKIMPKPTGPKATYTAEQEKDAFETERERLLGYRRDKDGKIVGGI